MKEFLQISAFQTKNWIRNFYTSITLDGNPGKICVE